MSLRWFLFTCKEERFPYQLFLEDSPGRFIHLKTQEKWPGPGKNIFCKFEGYCEEEELPTEKPIEKCLILSKRQYGRKLTIILDRKKRKRCWFIFLKKEYKRRPGEFYYQTFWITQSSAIGERRGAYIPRGGKNEVFEVIIDTAERYPYKFEKAIIRKENLPVGDYALVVNGEIVAVVERKTLDNFIHSIATYDALKMSLSEMLLYRYKAVVFEAPYRDFINPRKNPYYSPSYVADIIADLMVSFPEIQFVFHQGRKMANEWVYRWFKRINMEENKDTQEKETDFT